MRQPRGLDGGVTELIVERVGVGHGAVSLAVLTEFRAK
jgi:hypothetical protein